MDRREKSGKKKNSNYNNGINIIDVDQFKQLYMQYI